MKVLYYNRNRLSESEETALNVTFAPLQQLLSKSDYISLHCPLTSETRHLLGPKEFEKMKKGVYIINTARGPVIDELALLAALQSGKVGGAGLDVFEVCLLMALLSLVLGFQTKFANVRC